MAFIRDGAAAGTEEKHFLGSPVKSGYPVQVSGEQPRFQTQRELLTATSPHVRYLGHLKIGLKNHLDARK